MRRARGQGVLSIRPQFAPSHLCAARGGKAHPDGILCKPCPSMRRARGKAKWRRFCEGYRASMRRAQGQGSIELLQLTGLFIYALRAGARRVLPLAGAAVFPSMHRATPRAETAVFRPRAAILRAPMHRARGQRGAHPMKSHLTGDLHRAHGDSVTTPEDERMARAPMHRARGQRAEAGKAGTAVGTYAPARAGTAW